MSGFQILASRARLVSGIAFRQNRTLCLSSANHQKVQEKKAQLTASSSNSPERAGLGTKVKETSKTIGYSGVIVGGVIIAGIVFYTILKELFWSQSPQSIYSDALKKCSEHPKICDLLGEPITGFCDERGKRRRTNLRCASYMKDGKEHLQIRFYIKGFRNQAVVYADMEKKDGFYEYSYLLVEMESYPREKIFVIDKRIHELSFPTV